MSEQPDTRVPTRRRKPGPTLRLVPPVRCRIRPGERIGGRYRIREWIANGGMSEVWAARDEKLGRWVAVKIAVSGDGLPGIEILEHEAELLAGLDHPGIVGAYDVGRQGDLGYFVMPLLRGASLRRILDRLRTRRRVAPTPLCAGDFLAAFGGGAKGREVLFDVDRYRTVVRIMVEVLRAVEAAHSAQVLHRDLKPANVVLTPGGHPVLVDFGLGGRIDRPGPDAARLTGTPAFFAPEQLRAGCAGADVRTDVYQLGLLLQEFLTLEPVFHPAEPGVEILIQRGECRRPRRVDPRVPRALESMCLRARAADPVQRYRSATELRSDLVGFLESTAGPGGWLGHGLSRLSRLVRGSQVVGG